MRFAVPLLMAFLLPLVAVAADAPSFTLVLKNHRYVPDVLKIPANTRVKIEVINQKLGYLVRGGDPDAIDSIVPMAYGNLALDLINARIHGRLVVLKNGRYDNVPVDIVTASKKLVNVTEHYHTERYRPHYRSFEMKPLFLMTSD